MSSEDFLNSRLACRPDLDRTQRPANGRHLNNPKTANGYQWINPIATDSSEKKKTPKTWNTLICAIITCCLLPNGFFFSSPDARCGQDTSSSRSLRMLSCTTRSSRVRRVTSRDRHRGPKGRGNHRFGEKTEKKLTP